MYELAMMMFSFFRWDETMGTRLYVKAFSFIILVGIVSIGVVKIGYSNDVSDPVFIRRNLQSSGDVNKMKTKVKQLATAMSSEEDEFRRGSSKETKPNGLEDLGNFIGDSGNFETTTKRPDPVVLPERIVHLDLKGAPPKVGYLKKFFKLLRKLGATGILLEYEDMFPWTGLLRTNRHGNAYSLADVEQIKAAAQLNRLKIIPLVQTWGHLEWVLKMRKFAELREMPKYPQVVCPNHPDTFPLIKAMLDQMLAVHNDSDSIHIGADEAYYIAKCSRCQRRLDELGGSKDRLMTEHLVKVAKYVRKSHAVRVLVWNDMFDKTEPIVMRQSGLSELVEPVIWGYSEDLFFDNYFPPGLFDRVTDTFQQMWIASAFKGANGPDQVVVDVDHYHKNHLSWLNVMRHNSAMVPNVNGVILTGWQRFDHFATLCELLPVSIRSLAVNLLTMRDGRDSKDVKIRASKLLQCEPQVTEPAMDTVGFKFLPVSPLTNCEYPGSAISDWVDKLGRLKVNITQMFNHSSVKGWFTPYNIKMSYGHSFFAEKWYNKSMVYMEELEAMGVALKNELAKVYQEETVNEWLYNNVKADMKRLKEMQQNAAEIMSKTAFPVRPLPPAPVEL